MDTASETDQSATSATIHLLPQAALIASFDDALRQWRTWATQAKNMADTTVEKYSFGLLKMNRASVALLGKTLLECDEDDLEDILNTFTGIGAGARANHITQLRSLFKWAKRRKLVSTNNARELDTPKLPPPNPNPFTQKELDEVLLGAQTRPILLWWITLAAYSGARAIEMARLKGEDINLEEDKITFHGKGNKIATIPLHPKVKALYLKLELPRRGPVSLNTKGEPYTAAALDERLNLYLRSFPSGKTAHKLRAYFGSAVYDVTGDIYVCQELLRHSNIATTQRYVKRISEKGRNAVRGIN